MIPGQLNSMLFSVGEFCDRVESDMSGLADELQDLTGRYGEQERRSWMLSLPKLSVVLAKPELSDFHLSLGNSGHVSFEYRLPASSSWCDAVLLGQNAAGPAAVILELKEWDLKGDLPGPRESLIQHQGRLMLHPADQVRGYAEYCRRFHSAVDDFSAVVDGCVFFTSKVRADTYRQAPHESLTQQYPVFTYTEDNLNREFVPYLCQRLESPHPTFAKAFDQGVYRQDRNFVTQVADAISEKPGSPFVLLDEQRKGYEFCLNEIDKQLSIHTNKKLVVIIEGPPGSGKSVLAAHIWAALAKDEKINGNVIFATTSGCQRDNWEQLFQRMSGEKAGRGFVMPANRYNPGLSGKWVLAERENGYEIPVSDWEANLEHFYKSKDARIADNTFAVSIVDEAHALIDPTAPGAEGVPPSGWSMHAGPQMFHVMRCSQTSVFLLDSEQSYRDNETTTPASIRALADKSGINHTTISLKDSQFRCGGSAAYMHWLETLLSDNSLKAPVADWNSREHKNGPFAFQIVNDPQELNDRLSELVAEGKTARLSASYARKWKTKGVTQPHELATHQKDFAIQYERDSETHTWDNVWNYVPDGDYTHFIQAVEGSRISENPLCEVGCPYVIRGFDFDYLGVLWLSDLVWRTDRWVAQIDHVHETAWPKTKKAAKGKGKKRIGADTRELILRLQRGYRILLSRAIHGLYIWFEDAETREHVQGLLQKK